MRASVWKPFLIALMWTIAHTTRFAEECSYKFHFPTLQGSVLTAEEHANISLQFGLVSECGVPEDFKITVAKILQENSFKVVVCNIVHRNGSCLLSISDNVCSCLGQEGMYQLTKVLDRNDDGVWVWQKDNDARETKVIINVTTAAGSNRVQEPTYASKSKKPTLRPDETTLKPGRTTMKPFVPILNPDEPTLKSEEPTLNPIYAQGSSYFSEARSTIAAEEDDEETEQDFSSSGLGTGVIVLGSVGIVVLGATAIAAIIVCARRGTRNNEVAEQEQPDVRHEPSPNLERQNDIQARPPAPSMHIYWEIPDVPDRIEEESPEASGIQADNYLIPDPPAAGVVKGEPVPDDYQNAAPRDYESLAQDNYQNTAEDTYYSRLKKHAKKSGKKK